MPSHSKARTAAAELVLASGIWGYGFVATRHALGQSGPWSLMAVRFGAAFLLGMLVVLTLPSLCRTVTLRALRLAAVPGFFLALALGLQTLGLVHTTATKSAFLTTLYVLFVPLLAFVLGAHRIPKGHLGYVALALLGTALICGVAGGGFDGINRGDLATLGCAFASAGHIHLLGALGPRIESPFTFNVLQSGWAAVWLLAPAAGLEGVALTPSVEVFWGLGYLVVLSTLVAFFLQVRAQQHLDASLASLLCLLESPFGAVFAFIWLEERLDAAQWLGALLILAAAALAVRAETRPEPALL